MAVNNGQSATQETFNDAFVSRTQDSTTVGRVGLQNPLPESGTAISNSQRELNKLNQFTGAIPNTAVGTAPVYTNNEVGSVGDSLQARADALSGKFNSTGGHAHTGAPGDGGLIQGANIQGVPLEGWFNQGINIVVNGASINVSTQLTGKAPSTADNVPGVVVNTPYNRVILRQATGPDAGSAFVNGLGEEIYGRVTEAAGVWTLTFFVDNAGTETPYSFAGPEDARWFYQELYNPLVNTPVYDPGAFVPSDAATADVVDASATQRGLVNTAAQSFAGEKTFTDAVVVQGNLTTNVTANRVVLTDGSSRLVPIALAKGSLLTGDGTTPVAFPVGANGQVLAADSAEPSGLKWVPVTATPAASAVTFTPVGDVAATNVQDAIAEVDSEKARRNLSNLEAPTAINQALLPDTQNTRDVGSGSLSYRDVFAGQFKGNALTFSFVGDTTTGSPTITGIASTADLDVHQSVFGPGIPQGSWIISKTASSVTLNQNATATAGAQTFRASGMGAVSSAAQTGSVASGVATLNSGQVADGTSGAAVIQTGNATGTGSSGDVILRTGLAPSGTRGRALVNARYFGIPTRVIDPPDNLAGGIYWNTTNQVFRQNDGTAWSDLAGSGGGVGINFILNPDAEKDAAGWVTYQDANDPRPTDGVGGSPTVTFVRTTTTPLEGVASFLFTKPAANVRGEGFSYDFTIDRMYQGQRLALQFGYEILSGTYATGMLEFWIYDVTNNRLIQPDAFQLENVIGPAVAQPMTFQTSIDSTSYRLICHVNTTVATSFSVEFDQFILGPEQKSIGPVVSNFRPVSALAASSQGVGTLTNNALFQSQVGSRLVLRGRITIGTVDANTVRLPLPAGLTISTDANEISQANRSAIGWLNRDAANVNQRKRYSITGVGGQNFVELTNDDYTTAGSTFTALVGNQAFVSGETISLYFDVPIAGWSSNQVVSSAGTHRDVVLEVQNNSGPASVTAANSGTNAARILYSSPTINTHNTYNASTGTFAVPVAGNYRVCAKALLNVSTSGAWSLGVYRNGSAYGGLGNYSYFGAANDAMVDVTVPCVAGDTIDIRARVASGTNSVTVIADISNNLSIQRLPSQNQIAASSNVLAIVTKTAAQSFANATTQTVTYDTTVADTFGAFNLATERFIVPAPGYYVCSGTISFAANATGPRYALVNVNGTQNFVNTVQAVNLENTSINYFFTTPFMTAGQFIEIQARQECGAALNVVVARAEFRRVGGTL